MPKERLSEASNQAQFDFQHIKCINPPRNGGLIVLKQWDTLLLQRRFAKVSFIADLPTPTGHVRSEQRQYSGQTDADNSIQQGH